MPLANHPNVLGGGSPGAGVELSGGTSLVTKGVLYADSGNTVTTEAAFIYTATTNTLTVDNVVSNAATALSLSANGNVTINTTNGSTLAATFSGANTTLAGNLTVNGTGTSSFAGAISIAADSSANGIIIKGRVAGNGSVITFNSNAGSQQNYIQSDSTTGLQFGATSANQFTLSAGAGNALFSSTTSGTSTTAAAILGKSMGLTENLYVGGTGVFSNQLDVNVADTGKVLTVRASSLNHAIGYSSTIDGLEARGFGGFIWKTGTAGATEQARLTATSFALLPATEATTGGAGSLTTAGGIYAAKAVISAGPQGGANYTVAGLPAASSYPYCFAVVTNATLTAITGLGLAPTGGGANIVPVYSDGTNWLMI